MIKFFNVVAWIKIYFNNLSSYLGIVNFILLLLTFKSVYDINISSMIIVPLALFFGLLIGYLDYRFIQKPQYIISNKVNDLKDNLEEIKDLLKKNYEEGKDVKA